MRSLLCKLARSAAVGGSAAALALVPLAAPAVAAVEPAATAAAERLQAPDGPGDGTAQGAVDWFEQNSGDTSYEGLCEKAVENAWGTTGIWPSAIAHWEGAINAGKAHKGDESPPKGAFVYWNTSANGHVGIADGNGGFYSSSIDGALGHSDSLSYFNNYLGWSDPQVPA